MELDFTLNRKQEAQMKQFSAFMGEDSSWLLQRLQGSGLKFWRITWTEQANWEGDQQNADGKTLAEAIANTKLWISHHREYR